MAIQLRPIGISPVLSRPRPIFASKDFSQARSRVPRNLFGAPEKGEINEMYRKEQLQRMAELNSRYTLGDVSAVTSSSTTSNSKSTLEESLMDKEAREYQIKINQRNNKTAFLSSCNEAYRIGSRSLKQVKSEERIFVETIAKCSTSGERPKPYARQSALTDYYNQRKIVVCNNSRTSDVNSVEEACELLPRPIQENVGIESTNTTTTTTTTTSAVTTNESSSSSTHQCEHEQSQEQISLHTMTTDNSAELV